MSGTNTTDLNGLFKAAYADNIKNLIPEESILTRMIKFKGKEALLGDKYNQPVVVRSEQGFTYSRPNNGTFSLNGASSMKLQNAVVDGFIILEECGISYEAVARSTNVNSFRDAVDLVMQDAMESFGRRIEIGLLYGQSSTGLAQISDSTNVSATSTTLTVPAAQWASGIWTTMEGAKLDVHQSGGTVLNTAGAVTVSSVSLANKTITITAAAGDITAIDAYFTGVPTGYVRFYQGGSDGLDEVIGLDKIALNTGTLFGIDAATYGLWKANTYNVAGALTLAKIQAAVAVAVGRGLSEDLELFVSPDVWQSLSTEQVAYRMMDSSYSTREAKNGFETLVFHSQNGKVSVHAHRYVKTGDAFLVPTDNLCRIGSSDVSFNIPGTNQGQVFIQNATTAGFTFRVFSQQGLLCYKPATLTKLYGITVA